MTIYRMGYTFCIASFAFVQLSFAGNNFFYRISNYDRDTSICRAFVTNKTCEEVDNLVRNRGNFEKEANDQVASESEGAPFTRKYFQKGNLRIVEMGYAEQLRDTVTHYYLISQDRLFVVRILTPHPEELKEVIGGALSLGDKTPVVYGFLFDKNMKPQKEYSQQGKLHPSIPESEVDAVLSVYYDFGR